jgi:hypothetical protein
LAFCAATPRRLRRHGASDSHFADSPEDFWMPIGQARQRLDIEHVDPAPGLGDHVMLVRAAFEQRHLAEEITFLEHNMIARADFGHRFTAG